MARLSPEQAASFQYDFDRLSSNGIMSQNQILDYFGFDRYFGTITGDRLFKMFRSCIGTRFREAEEVKPFIDWEVFITLMSTITTGSLAEKCSLVFGLFDINKNQLLEKEDFITFYIEFFKTVTSEQIPKDRRIEELQKYSRIT